MTSLDRPQGQFYHDVMLEKITGQLAPFATTFWAAGFEVYLVGGAVRDLALEKLPKDYDFTTNAEPEQVVRLFKSVIPTGIKHGTVTVIFQGEKYEVTTFRTDGDYQDGRRPDQVHFTKSLEEDLKRRDFTINALALDLKTRTFIDHHQGLEDLQRRTLRAIGLPSERFGEDALRMFRLCRFAAQLDFSVAPDTWAGLLSQRNLVKKLSPERIREELEKTIKGNWPEKGLKLLMDSGLLPMVLPIFNGFEASGLDEASFRNLPYEVRLAALFLACQAHHDAKDILDSLKKLTFTNQQIKQLELFWKIKILADNAVPRPFKAILDQWGSRDVELPAAWLDYLLPESGSGQELKRIASSREPVFLKDLAVNGSDLQAWGIAAGPDMRNTLLHLQKTVWDTPARNTVNDLKAEIAKIRH